MANAPLRKGERQSGDCGCGPGWRAPKVNGTCGACGGWLPGERPAPLSWLGDDLKRAGEQVKRWEAER